jgi:hypothetical protein
MQAAETLPLAGCRAALTLDIELRARRFLVTEHRHFAQRWSLLRPALAGRDAVPPGIWHA